MEWTSRFDATRARAWLMRLGSAALLLGVFGTAVGELPKDRPDERSRRALNPGTVAQSTLFQVNRVIFILQDVGEIGSSGSSVASGGFWKAPSNAYVFSSGANVGGKLPDGTIVFANGGPFSELAPGSNRFPELNVFWESTDPEDRANFPEVCTVDAPRVQRFSALESFAGEPFPGFADKTVCIAVNDYLGGTCGECAGTRVGVTIVYTVFGFGVPTVQDFVFVMVRMYNDSRFINATNSPVQPPGPYTLTETVFSFAVDPDIGEAGDDQIAFLPDIQSMVFWDNDFNEPDHQGTVGFGGIGLVVLPTDPNTGAELPLAEFSVFTNGAPRPDPNQKEVWYAIQRGDPAQVILEVDPRDVRGMVSTVPFTIEPDQFVEMGAAYFFAEPTGPPPAALRAQGYKNLQTGQLNPNANTNPVFNGIRAVAQVAAASGNAGFLQPVAPPSPDFELLPGDHQVTVLWGKDPISAANPFARLVRNPFDPADPVATGIILAPGDVVFVGGQFQTAAEAGIAGREVTSAIFNPNFVVFDFEGFRVYRSRTGLADQAELIAQFDLANQFAGGLFCIEAIPVFFEGEFVENVCTETDILSGPGGAGEPQFGSNTGLAFVVVDRGGLFPNPADGPGLINGIPVAYAVTSYAVQCGILLPVIPEGTATNPTAGCLNLESGKVFQFATPRSDPNITVSTSPPGGTITALQQDGSVCDTDEPTATVDATTGKYVDLIDCSNAIVGLILEPIGSPADVPDGEFVLVIDRLDADCVGVPPNCYTLATGDANQRVHYHWERANGQPATDIVPQSGIFVQNFGFFHASETLVPSTLFNAEGEPVLTFQFAVVSDFGVIEDLEVNGRSVHLGELGGAHIGEARPHAVQNSELADIVSIGWARAGAVGGNNREYSHPSSYGMGGTQYELTWEVQGNTFTGTMRQLPNGPVIPRGGQPRNAENHSTPADFIPGWNWCFVGPGTMTDVTAAMSPTRAGPCVPNNTIQLQAGDNFGIYVPGNAMLIQGIRQLPQNGDRWTFRLDTGSQRALFGREGTPSNAPTGPFHYEDINDATEEGEVLEPFPWERGIVSVYPGMKWRLSLTGGAAGDIAFGELSRIKVVPNPFFAVNEITRGRGLERMLFTNLPPVATIRIYTISGNLVRVLEHTDGSGTAEYDVRTRFDLILASGNYYYHVTTPDGRTHLGRFAVVN